MLLGAWGSGEIVFVLQSSCNGVVSDFATWFTLPWTQTVLKSRTKFMKVCEKPCSMMTERDSFLEKSM